MPFTSTHDGLTTADVLSIDQQPFVATEPSFVAADVDEAAFMYRMERPQLIKRMTTLTMAGDTPLLLGTVPVCPNYGFAAGVNFQPGNLALHAQSFKFWTGPLEYKIVIPANPLTRCRIAVMYSLNKQSTFSENSRYMYVDIEGTTVIDGVIPWCRSDPYGTIPDYSGGGSVSTNSVNGYLHFFQISNLVADTPAVTPSPLGMLVFAAATPDLKFAGVRFPVIGAAATLTRGVAQQNFLGLKSNVRIDRLLAEDNITSIRQLLHRIVQVGDITLGALGTTTTVVLSPPWEIAWFLYSFKYWRGSFTAVLTAVDNCTDTQNVAIDSNANGSVANDHDVLWYPNMSPRFAFVIPYIEMKGYSDSGGVTPVSGMPRIMLTNHAVASYKLRWSIAFNDDLSLGIPVAPWYKVT